jgi:hypothetical protein
MNKVSIQREQQPGNKLVVSSKDLFDGEWCKIGAFGDTHLYSKYARLDVLNCLYDVYEKERITAVYHTGNMMDGQCRFNQFDLVGPGGIILASELPSRHK